MKKLLTLSLAILLLFSVFTACSPKVNDKPKDDFEVNVNIDKNITATLEIMVPDNDQNREKSIIDAVAKGFNIQYPNVTIKTRGAEISDEKYMETIGSLLQVNRVPDLVYTNTALYYYLISKNVVLPLNAYFDAAIDADLLDMADYHEEYFDMASYEGKRYAMPRNADTVVTYYNKDMLEAAGIVTSGPNKDARLSNDWTWDDFVSINKDLVTFWDKDRVTYNKYYGIRQTVLDWESIWNPLMLSMGASVYKDGAPNANSTEMKAFANLYKELVTEKITPAWDSGSESRFSTGTAAFEFASDSPGFMSRDEAVKGKFDILPFPKAGDNGKIGTGFAGWGIYSGSKNADLAWAFLQYLISYEGQMAIISGNPYSTPSVLRSINEEKGWTKGYESLNIDAFMYNGENKVTPQYFKGFDPKYMFEIQYAIQDFTHNILNSKKSVDDAISLATTKLAAAIK